MEGIIMTLVQTTHNNLARRATSLGIAVAFFAISTPLPAQDTVVEGTPQRNNLVQERVDYTDLDLRYHGNQMVLISRVRQASDRVCDIVYKGESPVVKFNGRCTQRAFRTAKPQIDVAIANALEGKRVAMSFVIAASR